MAAPTATAIGTPAGIKLDTGYQTRIVFSRRTTIGFWEKSVQPPAVDGGPPIMTSTMRNAVYETKAANDLIDHGESQVTCAWDPQDYADVISYLINQEGTVTIQFPDGSTLAFYGYLAKFAPGAMTKGAQPEATLTIIVTNWDPTNRVEAGPVMTQVSGT